LHYNSSVSLLRAYVDAVCAPEMRPGREYQYLREACYAGLLGVGYISPNPAVGALLVRDNEVVARGVHRTCGKEHAEAEALARAKERAQGAHLYLGLEPCTHQGKQPPCTDAVIRSGVTRVIYAGDDPDPRTCRHAKPVLAAAGIDVRGPLLPRAMARLNDAFYYRQSGGGLFATLKLALSLDGRLALAGGDSQWISGKAAQGYAHYLRQSYDAVLVGAGTVRTDNPRLTVRKALLRQFLGTDADYIRLRHPVRVAVDPEFSLLEHAESAGGELEPPPWNLFSAPVERRKELPWLVLVGSRGRAPAGKRLPPGVELVETACGSDGHFEYPQVWEQLQALGITSVLIEGGERVAQSVLAQRAFVRFDAIVAPLLLGRDARGFSPELELLRVEDGLHLEDVLSLPLGRDTLVSGYAGSFIDGTLRRMPQR